MTAALQRCTTFADDCSSIGPMQAAFHAVALAQECTNCTLDLHAALSRIDAQALGVGIDLQEDLTQFVRQLSRLCTFKFPQDSYDTIAQLQKQVQYRYTVQAVCYIIEYSYADNSLEILNGIIQTQMPS